MFFTRFCGRACKGLPVVVVCALLASLHLPVAAVAAAPSYAGGTLGRDPQGWTSGFFSLAPSGSSGQEVTLYSGDLDGSIYGGVALEGSDSDISGNTATMRSGSVQGGIVGGWTEGSGDVYGNSAVVEGGTVGTGVYGGLINDPGEAGWSSSGDVYNNTVTILGGTLGNGDDAVVGGATGGSGSVYGNTVNISGGSINGHVYGATSKEGDAYGNTVNISGESTTISESVSAGFATIGDSYNNMLNISSGHISDSVMGGRSVDGNANNNVVNVGGDAVIDGNIYGGLSQNGDAVNNTVGIYGSPDLSSTWLYGGYSENAAADVVTGNTLNMYEFSGYVEGIGNFQTINMVLPSTVQSGDVIITAGTANLDGATFNVNMAGGGDALQSGESITLISADTMTGSVEDSAKGTKGSALFYDFDLSQNGNDLVATVVGVQVNPQYRSLSEGRLAGLALLSQGADMAADQGLRAAAAGANPEAGASVFTVGGGGISRYAVGSHMDMNTLTILTGVAWNSSTLDRKTDGSWTAGVFFEAGRGDYGTNDSHGGMGVDGDGESNYYGGGILGRYQTPFGMYVEASARVGRTNTDFGSGDIYNAANGETADYESESLYYGAHAGLGYIYQLTDKASMDVFTKYLWTHQGDDDLEVTGDEVNFQSVDSQRWRTGARFSYAFSSENWSMTPYLGAGYEYEFDGKADASTYGYDVDQAELSGGTGLGEVGISLKPIKHQNISMDLGIQGYTGVRESVGGTVQLGYKF